jgi:hypothetical protein
MQKCSLFFFLSLSASLAMNAFARTATPGTSAKRIGTSAGTSLAWTERRVSTLSRFPIAPALQVSQVQYVVHDHVQSPVRVNFFFPFFSVQSLTDLLTMFRKLKLIPPGKLCERRVSECDSSPCLNNATCVDNVNGNFSCDCLPGYEGIHWTSACTNVNLERKARLTNH